MNEHIYLGGTGLERDDHPSLFFLLFLLSVISLSLFVWIVALLM